MNRARKVKLARLAQRLLRVAFWAGVLAGSLMSGWSAWQVGRKVTKLESEVYLLRVVPMMDGVVAPQYLESPDGSRVPFPPVQRF